MTHPFRDSAAAKLWAGGVIGTMMVVGFMPLSARAANNAPAEININAARVENPISSRLYGQFIEDMFEGVEGPLWAELIRNRSFEEPPNEIGLSRDWRREPDDRDHDPAIHFGWDGAVHYPAGAARQSASGHSMRIEITPDQWDVRQRRGISQGRIPVRKGISYHGSVWLKGDQFSGFMTVALAEDRPGGATYSSADIPVRKTGWTQYHFKLSPDSSDPLAKLCLLFHGLGTIWIDQVSLMPGDAVDGARPDVFRLIKALRPSFIRWPGGNVAQAYHWMWGVGPRDSRPYWVNHAWWNEIQASDFGTDEFIQLCHDLNTEPSITVNVEGNGATAEEAAGWVEYANGPAGSKYGRMRAANGHPQPYHVKYWEVGNEIFGKWEIGHTTAEVYAHNLNRYVSAMRAIDPRIQIIASGSEDLAWDRTLLSIAAKNIDYLAIHHYYGAAEMHGDTANLLARPLTYNAFYAALRQLLHQYAPDGHIRLSVNEWNTALPVPAQHTMVAALYAGRMMNSFEDNGDVIAMSAISDLVNGWSGGVIQSTEYGSYVTPDYLVNRLYNDHLGAERLAATVSSPAFNTPQQGRDIPYLDATVTRSADGKRIFIKAVNTNLHDALAVRIHLTGASVAQSGEMDVITAASPGLANDFRTPANVSERTTEIRTANDFAINLASDSVSVITLDVN